MGAECSQLCEENQLPTPARRKNLHSPNNDYTEGKAAVISASPQKVSINRHWSQTAINTIESHREGSTERSKEKFKKLELLDVGNPKEKKKQMVDEVQLYFDTFISPSQKQSQQISKAEIDGVCSDSNLKTIVFCNGIKYVGEWWSSSRHGQGKQTWPDGATYVGDWKENKANGKGRFTHPNGDYYDGQWTDDRANGFGLFHHVKSGAKYQGYWVNDMQQGIGDESYSDGERFKGMFKEGRRNGEGTCKFPGGQVYQGEWCEGRIEGYGECTWADGRSYKGNWLQSKKNGQGIYRWPDGSHYEGAYRNDRRHGKGTFTWADRRQYIGEWKNDKRHGAGKYIIRGVVKEGFWEDDIKVQQKST